MTAPPPRTTIHAPPLALPAMSALSGIRVLELSRVLAGPWSGMTLADLGAEVIKLEPPEGDDTRGLGPPFRHGLSAYFACCNRNKRSLTLDLSDPRAQPVVARLAQWADVVIENYRTGVAERLGVDYATLAALNPRLVYCSISGYGRDGSAAHWAGYDFVVQAEAGLMSITGPVDGMPAKVGVAVADLFTGQNATTAILAALLARERSGRGQRIEVSLFDSQLQMLANVASSVLFTDADAARHGNAHASIVPYQAFAAADGELAVAVASEPLWRAFCVAMARPQWSDDPRYVNNAQRVVNREALATELAGLFIAQPVAHWVQRLRAAGVPAAPVNSVADALAHRITAERGMRIQIDDVPMLGSPLKLADSPVQYRHPPPALGQHRDAILRELGFDPQTLAERPPQPQSAGTPNESIHTITPEPTP
jgi:crotonobetainyl-CoA:carnitine CoA-transferase CaiB-like acyl-CoA transferase